MALFDKQQAGVQMTLAGLAYVDEGLAINKLKQALIQELTKVQYATRGLWSLAWGPVVHGAGDNLVYVAQQVRTSDYAIVLRGTVDQRGSIWEDVATSQSAFPFIHDAQAKVSSHFLTAQQALLSGRDPDTGKTLDQFFAGVATAANLTTIFVTGHSQGAALVSMFLPWVLQQSPVWGGAVHCLGYSFAPPTAGDPVFANWIGEHTNCFQVINPLDVVPLGYAGIKDIITDRVPGKVPEILHPAIDIARDVAELAGPWQQPATLIKLDRVQLPDSISYLDQVAAQHNHNSYLYLLGAPQTAGDPSLLPNYPQLAAGIA